MSIPWFIRLDKNHVINAATKWAYFRQLNDKRVKDYYFRSISYAMEIQNLNNLTVFIINLFIVAVSSTANEESVCKKVVEETKSEFKTFEHEEYDCNKSDVTTTHEISEIMKNNGIVPFLNDCRREAEMSIDPIITLTSEPNDFYCPGIFNDFAFNNSIINSLHPLSNIVHCPGIVNNLFCILAHFPSFT